jgi:hypothetical protein
MRFLLMPLCGLGFLACYFQGPAVTAVVIAIWVFKIRKSKPRDLISLVSEGISKEFLLPPKPLREKLLWSGLEFISLAVILDWYVIFAVYSKGWSVGTATESITLIAAVVSATAALLAVIGYGRCRVSTLMSAFVLLIASSYMLVLERCHHVLGDVILYRSK